MTASGGRHPNWDKVADDSVVDRERRREAARIFEAAAEAVRSGDDPAAFDEARDVLDVVARRNPRRHGSRIRDSLPSTIARIKRRHSGEEKPIPLPWPRLSALLGGGLWPGLYVIVGNTGSGKSQWAVNVALHAALASVPTLYIGIELDRHGLDCRFAGLATGAQWSDLYKGRATVDTAHPGLDRLIDAPLVIRSVEDGGPYGFTTQAFLAAGHQLRAEHPAAPSALVVLDFLQIIGRDATERGDSSLRERIGRAAYAGRQLAVDLNAAVLLVSSTSRDKYEDLSGAKFGTGSPGALVGSGKESGEVEYAADGVLVMGKAASGSVTIGTAKIRASGDEGWVPFAFDGTRFEEIETPVAMVADAAPAARRTEFERRRRSA